MAKYGEAASKNVESTMRSRKQAIAIALNEAREKGAKVPSRKSSSAKRSRKTTGSRKRR